MYFSCIYYFFSVLYTLLRMKKIRLRSKIFILYLSLFVVAVNLSFIFFYRYAVQMLTTKYTDSVKAIVLRTMQQTEALLLDLDRTALFCISNPVIVRFLSHDLNYDQLSGIEQSNLDRTFITIALPASRPPLRASIYNQRGKYFSFGIPDNVDVVKENFASGFFKTHIASGIQSVDTINISLPHADYWSKNRKRLIISIFRVVTDLHSFEKTGYAEIQVPFEEITKILNGAGAADFQKLIFNKDGFAVYTENNDAPEFYADIINKIGLQNTETGIFEIKNKKRDSLIFYSRFSSLGWTTVFIDNKLTLHKNIRNISFTFFMLTFVLTAFFASAGFLSAKKITQPLERAIKKIEDTASIQAELPITEKDQAKDETDFISSTFNRLFEKLQDSVHQKNIAKTEELKAHFIALQSQIDPHFLYNMLAVISACSREQNHTAVIKICTELSSMFRYITVFNEQTVTLHDELEHTGHYLSLMHIRFGEQADIRIEVDKNIDTQKIKVPRLIIQPLVENCFSHAFKRIEPPWKLYIKVYAENNKWHCTISDNGCGIDEKKHFEIFYAISEFLIDPAQHIEEVRIGGMGLINTGVRLKMFAGVNALFEIRKSRFGGTEIHIGGSLNDSCVCC